MTEAINERIKKLLRIGQPNSGATEHEAETAMSMAAALMLKHGIEVQLDDETTPGAKRGDRIDGDEMWHRNCAQAAAYLYNCRLVVWTRGGQLGFVGRSDNIDACEMTYTYLRAEVERMYKLHLPKGLSQSDRAEYRRTFKFACSRRLQARAWAIMETLRRDDLKAIEATGSRALVVVATIDQQLAEADALLSDVRKLPVVSRRAEGMGTDAGRRAGNAVELQRRVE